MTSRAKIIFGVLIFVSLVLGIICGHLWKDLPVLKFNNEVKLYEVLNLLLTLSIGIIIPLLVKKWIDDNRSIKSCLVDEVKNVISTLNKINLIISTCHNKCVFTKENRDEIVFLFHSAELQMTSFDEQLQLSFPSQSKDIMGKLKDKYYKYERFLTGGDMMLSTFEKIDNRFYREQSTEHSQIETHLKTIIHLIHKI
jgi:hypothetical protein